MGLGCSNFRTGDGLGVGMGRLAPSLGLTFGMLNGFMGDGSPLSIPAIRLSLFGFTSSARKR